MSQHNGDSRSRGKSRNKNNNYNKRNPKRGGPGILLSCETGREVKCQREGIEILRYYFNNQNSNCIPTSEMQQQSNATTSANDQNVNDDKDNVSSTTSGNEDNSNVPEKKKELSLEEEIAMLKNGASPDDVLQHNGGNADNNNSASSKKWKKKKKGESGPFHVYDTGCRGTVFVMYTPVGKNKEGPSSSDCTGNENLGNTINDLDDAQKISDGRDDKNVKRKAQEDYHEGTTSSKKIKRDNDIESDIIDNKEDTSVPDSTSSSTWNPIQTVQKILQDLTNEETKNNVSIPSSRFVTRMIPIQATCFASMAEINETAQSLLKNHLLPAGLNYASKRKEEGKKNCSQPTFKIEFRKRYCSHIKRDDVISQVADLVTMLTKESISKRVDNSSNGDGTTSGEIEPPELFSVNLTDPDYTIHIEICRTLCGMSVLPNIKEYSNFNLMTIKEKGQSEKNTV